MTGFLLSILQAARPAQGGAPLRCELCAARGARGGPGTRSTQTPISPTCRTPLFPISQNVILFFHPGVQAPADPKVGRWVAWIDTEIGGGLGGVGGIPPRPPSTTEHPTGRGPTTASVLDFKPDKRADYARGSLQGICNSLAVSQVSSDFLKVRNGRGGGRGWEKWGG